MLSSLRALVPKAGMRLESLGSFGSPSSCDVAFPAVQGWSPDHEVAWNWLWETVERLLSKERPPFAQLDDLPQNSARTRSLRNLISHILDFVAFFPAA